MRTDEQILADIGTFCERRNLHIPREWRTHMGKRLASCPECRYLTPIIDALDREYFRLEAAE